MWAIRESSLIDNIHECFLLLLYYKTRISRVFDEYQSLARKRDFPRSYNNFMDDSGIEDSSMLYPI